MNTSDYFLVALVGNSALTLRTNKVVKETILPNREETTNLHLFHPTNTETVMKTPFRLFAMALTAALLGTGCATVTKGPNQNVTVTSEPEGAVIYVDGAQVGQTPANVRLQRGDSYQITLQKPGYEPHQVEVRPVWNEARARTVRFGLDRITGADTDLEPREIFAQLERDPAAGDVVVSELAERVLRLDERLYRGEITRRQHESAMATLLRRYTQ